MNPELKNKYDEWMQWDKNEQTRKELANLKEDELKERLLKRMAFGTAGLRARMGAGYSQMNDLTIIQTTQGLLTTCKKHDYKKGIIIGYDARRNSEKWAAIIANIFDKAGIKVYLYSDTVPTPFVAFGVRHFGTLCGVMVTASHNPKDDNGYKVYWDNGSQIISPLDAEIASDIVSSLKPLDSSWQFDGVEKKVKDPLAEVEAIYYDITYKQLSSNPNPENLKKVSVVYTAMHGVGWPYCKKALERFGVYNIFPVKEQVERDPDFPTVSFPNPEEKGALDLAVSTANQQKVPLVIANDPDADRFAAAECCNGTWKVFSGNELGALFGWWIWTQFKKKNVNKTNHYMLCSTVSSKILRSIGEKEGFKFVETLTGFKWMGNLSHNLIQGGKTVMFAFEEAIGFMCGSVVLDKDGISAAAVFVEMAAHIYDQHDTISGQLAKIYQTYGHHISNNGYLKSKSGDMTGKMFESLRNWEGTVNNYPQFCGIPKFKVTKIRDLTTGYYSYEEEFKLPSDASNQMITFTFANNCTLTIRASGTEPKIKYYSEIILDPSDKTRSVSDVTNELQELITLVKKHFYQQDVFGFTN